MARKKKDEKVNSQNFRDATGTILKLGDLVTYTGWKGTLKLITGRIVAFQETKIKVTMMGWSGEGTPVPAYELREPECVAILNRNNEISQFPDEWLEEFWNKRTNTFNWSSIDSALNKTIS